nr:Uncharacterised protein [Klebsiella pneumoniae]
MLYEELGTKKAREELANRFPMGSASSIIDEMVVNQGGERDSEEESQTMAMKLAKEIISDVRRDSDDKNRKSKTVSDGRFNSGLQRTVSICLYGQR